MNSILDQLEFPAGTLLGEIRPWLESGCARNYQSSTIKFLHNSFRCFSNYLQTEHGVRSYRDVGRDNLNAFAESLSKRRLQLATQENYLQTVKGYFAWLEKAGRIFENPARFLTVPRRTRQLQRVLSERELSRLIDGITGIRPHDDLDRALLEVAYGTGLRLSELSSLTIESIDVEGCTVRVLGKGPKERIVPLTRRAAHATRIFLRRGRRALLGGRTVRWSPKVRHRGSHNPERIKRSPCPRNAVSTVPI